MEAVQFSVKVVAVMALDASPVGTDGAVVSPAAEVVTGSAVESAETFPAASLALIVTECTVEAARPVMSTVVPAGDAFSTEFTYTS